MRCLRGGSVAPAAGAQTGAVFPSSVLLILRIKARVFCSLALTSSQGSRLTAGWPTGSDRPGFPCRPLPLPKKQSYGRERPITVLSSRNRRSGWLFDYPPPSGTGGNVVIKLTRRTGAPFVVNAELIKFVEEVPDTIITLRDGEKILVLESADDVVGKSIE
ncbi:MAG: flagellar FlbD family protein, partial [Planctomycetes bacterium]|nr:flagellar FlbD family protein [Planctomycetota bacterium]